MEHTCRCIDIARRKPNHKIRVDHQAISSTAFDLGTLKTPPFASEIAGKAFFYFVAAILTFKNRPRTSPLCTYFATFLTIPDVSKLRPKPPNPYAARCCSSAFPGASAAAAPGGAAPSGSGAGNSSLAASTISSVIDSQRPVRRADLCNSRSAV